MEKELKMMCFSNIIKSSLFVVLSSCTFGRIRENEDNSSDNSQFGISVIQTWDSNNVMSLDIFTPDRIPIISKDEYMDDILFLLTSDEKEILRSSVGVKGRGNSTWKLEKKPYVIRFDKKQSFYSLPKAKKWLLLSNIRDKTMLRTDLASYIGNLLSLLDWTPKFNYLSLSLNDSQCGLYQFGEKVSVTKGRVGVGENGFLLEIDLRAKDEVDSRFFKPQTLVNIKYPEVEYGDANYEYARKYIELIDSVLFSDNFDDPYHGFQKYIDVDSFVDWFLINEISKNADACCFFSSNYMHFERNGKLKMGPIWDYDLAFGNYPTKDHWANEIVGFAIPSQVAWYARLMQSPFFLKMLKKRFDYFYKNINNILKRIDYRRQMVMDYAIKENSDYGQLCDKDATYSEFSIEYNKNVEDLKMWITNRMVWMKTAIDNL